MKHILLSLAIFFSALGLRATNHTVTVKDYSFSPSTLTVNQGDTVTWNFTEGSHTTTSGSSCSPDGKWDSGTKGSGTSYSYIFSSAGTFNYFCKPHCSMGMVGSVTVNSVTSGMEVPALPTVDLSIYPNPFSGRAIVTVSLSKAASLKIAVYDLNGKVIKDFGNITAVAGSSSYEIAMENAPAGTYAVRVYSDGMPAATRMLVKIQ